MKEVNGKLTFRKEIPVSDRGILLTIQNIHAKIILAGSKYIEYRMLPQKISEPTGTIMYVSSESGEGSKKVRKIVGEFMMGPVAGELTDWGFPHPMSNVIRYSIAIPWKSVRTNIPDIVSPQQNFRYLRPTSAADLKLLEMLEPHRIAGAKIGWG